MNETIDWTPKARAVLVAASDLFYERGIHAVGVDLIAERAGVTKKTIYDRFGSKQRLVVEYLAEHDKQWRSFLDRHLAQADLAPREQLVAVFDAAAAWSRERGGKGCRMINAHAEISDSAHPAHAVIVGQKRWMLTLFTELATAVGVTEPQQVGEHILLLHEGAVVSAGMHAFEEPFTRAADAAAALLD